MSLGMASVPDSPNRLFQSLVLGVSRQAPTHDLPVFSCSFSHQLWGWAPVQDSQPRQVPPPSGVLGSFWLEEHWLNEI